LGVRNTIPHYLTWTNPSHRDTIPHYLTWTNPSHRVFGALTWTNPSHLGFYNVTIDEIIHYSKATPKEVTIEDKTAVEQVRLLAQLNEKDKGTVMNIIDTMLTKQKFQNFFEQNLETTK
jgi:hypothetical protein